MSYIQNPGTPYSHPLKEGLGPGKSVRIQGRISSSAQHFAITLKCGSSSQDDIGLYLSPRFNESAVLRNARSYSTWGVEERLGSFPFVRGQPFEILILSEGSRYLIAVNGQHFAEFVQRIPNGKVNRLEIEGDVTLTGIQLHGTTADGFAPSAPPPLIDLKPGAPAASIPPPLYAPAGVGPPPLPVSSQGLYPQIGFVPPPAAAPGVVTGPGYGAPSYQPPGAGYHHPQGPSPYPGAGPAGYAPTPVGYPPAGQQTYPGSAPGGYPPTGPSAYPHTGPGGYPSSGSSPYPQQGPGHYPQNPGNNLPYATAAPHGMAPQYNPNQPASYCNYPPYPHPNQPHVVHSQHQKKDNIFASAGKSIGSGMSGVGLGGVANKMGVGKDSHGADGHSNNKKATAVGVVGTAVAAGATAVLVKKVGGKKLLKYGVPMAAAGAGGYVLSKKMEKKHKHK